MLMCRAARYSTLDGDACIALSEPASGQSPSEGNNPVTASGHEDARRLPPR
jgi:hypothetical protein